MAVLIYIDPRDNPEYYYKQVLHDINTNFSAITTGAIGVSGSTNLQNGLNTYTGGTQTFPSVNVSAATLNYLSATTISGSTYKVENYIDFVGVTGVTAVSGRTYYSIDENALTYKPITTNMDVSVNIGQETLIYVCNNSGVNILNGQACYISGSFSGYPSIALANASAHTSAISFVSGIATHDIANGECGFITNFGIVHDLNITGVSVGAVAYLSDTTSGGFVYDRTLLETSSRTNIIGRVISTGATTGVLGVSIKNEDPLSILTLRETNLNVLNTISTGLYEYTGMTLATSTTFNMPPIKGWIVYNTGDYAETGDIIHVTYSGQTGLTTPYLATSNQTHIVITSAGTLSYYPTEPTPQQRRENIHIGHLIHGDRTSISYIIDSPDYNVSPTSQLRDMFEPIGYINNGITPSVNGANLNFNVSSGDMYGLGINWTNNNQQPNTISITASTPTTFKYRTQTGGTTGNVTLISPTFYDVGGVVTALPGGANVSTNQRIYMLTNNEVRVQYGQTTYTSLANAITGVDTESFVQYDVLSENAILIGVLSVRKGATDLSLSTDARFTLASKFGEVVGGTGGISTTTLQQAYNNSTSPEITTDSALGAVTIQNGSGSNDNNALEIQNSGSTLTAFITGAGAISGTSVSANTINSGSTNLSNIFLNVYDDKRLLSHNSSTGIVGFSGLTINSDNTKFNVGAIKGWFVDNFTDINNPSYVYKEFDIQSAITATYLSSSTTSYIGINSGGTIQQSISPFTSTQHHSIIPLGVLVHVAMTAITSVTNLPDVMNDVALQLKDLSYGLSIFNISGNIWSANGANLKLNKSSGTLFRYGANFINDAKNPHQITLTALTQASFQYRLSNGGSVGGSITDVNPNIYESPLGSTASTTVNRFTIQRIYNLSEGIVRIQPGQNQYTTMSLALQALAQGTDSYVENTDFTQNGLLRCFLIIREGTTDLTDTARVLFLQAPKFPGGSLAGSLGTTTLQQAYNNSTTPEIITDSTLGALTLQNNSGSDANNVIEFRNSGATITAYIRGNGDSSFNNFSASTIYSGSTNLYDIFLQSSTSGSSANLWSASTGTRSIIANNGTGNLASGIYASVLGGTGNTSSGTYSSVVNGIDNTASGAYSVAEGFSALADGLAAHAEGYNTRAGGPYGAHSEGLDTVANGQSSHAEGVSTQAQGTGSHAEGSQANAYTDYSHAEGRLTISYGSQSHAEGSGTTAGFVGGNSSHAEGIVTYAYGNASHAEGLYTRAGGAYSHAEGESTSASGQSSHAEGNGTTASGAQSHAEGLNNTASGLASHAEGGSTTASNNYSHAEGVFTVASGGGAHAEGGSTTARGTYSHAGGQFSIASGLTSFVHGNTSIAGGTNTNVLGANITGLTDNTTYLDYLNIKRIFSGTPAITLGLDSIGNVVTGTTGSSGGATVDNGLNTYTAGTSSFQSVNISAATLNYLSATTISATTAIVGERGGATSAIFNAFGSGTTYSSFVAKFYNNTGDTMYSFTDAGRMYLYNPGGTANMTFEAKGTSGVAEIISNQTSLIFETSNGEYNFKRTTAGNVLMYTNGKRFDLSASVGGAPNVSIDTVGNLGVGTTAPYTPLHVVGKSYLGGGVTAETLNIQVLTGTSVSTLGIDSEGRVVSGATGGGGGATINNGLNTYTGGSASNTTVNVSAATLDNIFVSGDTRFNTMSASTISATTIYSNTISATTYYNVPDSIGATYDGQGGVISTGNTTYRVMGYAGRIVGWDIVSTVTGACIFDVWKIASGATLPTVANSIAGTEKPTLLAGYVSSDTDLLTWTGTTFSAGDIIAYNVDSASTVTRVTLSLRILKQ